MDSNFYEYQLGVYISFLLLFYITIVQTVFRETAETVILMLTRPSARLAYATSLESKTHVLPLPLKSIYNIIINLDETTKI